MHHGRLDDLCSTEGSRRVITEEKNDDGSDDDDGDDDDDDDDIAIRVELQCSQWFNA